jgi:RNA polymerase sigma factor (sigma-70 family)
MAEFSRDARQWLAAARAGSNDAFGQAPNPDGSTGHPSTGGAAETSPPSSPTIEHEQALALRQALARLPADYSRVLLLRLQEGKSFEEIGPLMNLSPDEARTLWGRAMEQLRQEWKEPR